MSLINFNAPAVLEKTIVAKLDENRYGITHVVQIFSGTLTQCLYQFDRKPESQKRRYSILTNDTARIGKCNLYWRDVERLAQEPNYPLCHN
jgi:hypothetical protein